jgi:hypothetical protein
VKRRATLAAVLAVAAGGCAAGEPGGGHAPQAGAASLGSAPQAGAASRASVLQAGTASSASAMRAVEALVDLDARRLGIRVALRGPRRGLAARLDRETDTVTLFASGTDAPHRLAHDLAHELGHAVDLSGLSAVDRRAYLARRGRPRAAWWPPAEVATDYGTGAGDFAEVFALCHAASPVFRSRLAPHPPDACALLPPAASSYVARASKDIG